MDWLSIVIGLGIGFACGCLWAWGAYRDLTMDYWQLYEARQKKNSTNGKVEP